VRGIGGANPNGIMNRLGDSGSISDGARGQTETLLRSRPLSALRTLGLHLPEYLMEAGELGLYMFVTCAFATLLQHPASPLGTLLPAAWFAGRFMDWG